MKKLFIAVSMLLFANYLYSQDVSVDKGQISIDNVPVAKITKAKGVYTISTMDDVPKLKMKYQHTMNGEFAEIKNPQEDKMNLLKLQIPASSFSIEKWFAENLIKGDTKLIDKNGLNDDQINNFFNTDNGNKTLLQDVDVSKQDEIQLDNVSVAKITKLKDLSYQVSSLKGDFTFFVDMHINSVNAADKSWLQFKSQDGNKINEVYFTAFRFSLNNTKLIADYLVKSEYHLIDKNGINEANVNLFLDSARTPISTSIALAKKEQNEVYEFCKTSGIAIDNFGNITRNSQPVGKLVKTAAYQSHTYKMIDLSNNNILAQATYAAMTNGCDITLSNKTVLHKNIEWMRVGMTADNKELSRDALANELVNYIYYKGYSLEGLQQEIVEAQTAAQQQIRQAKIDQQQATETALKQAFAISNAKGYVIDKDGKKTEGNISIEFTNTTVDNSGLVSLNKITKSYGNTVTITTTDESGKTKSQEFKAKDGAKFVVENNGTEESFIGVPKTMEDGGVGNADGFSSAQFYQILYENNGNYVLSHKKHPTDYYLQLKNNDRAIYLGYKTWIQGRDKKKENVQKVFDTYVNCSSLNFNDYDTQTLDGMKKIVDDYISKCNK